MYLINVNQACPGPRSLSCSPGGAAGRVLVSGKAGREDPREEARLSLLGCQALGFVLEEEAEGEACRWALPGRLAQADI